MNHTRKILTALAILAGIYVAQSQTNLELIRSTDKERVKSYARANISEKLTDDLKTYNYLEIYGNGTFFGKNALSFKLMENIGILNQTVYGTAMDTRTGLGVFEQVGKPDTAFIKLYAVPYAINLRGETLKEKANVGYFIEYRLDSWKFIGFGEFKPYAKPGQDITYMEFALEKNISKNFSIGANALAKGKSGEEPYIDYRLVARISLN